MTQEMYDGLQRRRDSRLFFLQTASMVTSFVIFFGTLIFGIWLFRQPRDPLTMDGRPEIVGMTGVQRGSMVFYRFGYCRADSGTVRLSRELIQRSSENGVTIIPLPEVSVTLEEGCHQIQMPLGIPPVADVGMYALRLTFADVSSARRRETSTESDPCPMSIAPQKTQAAPLRSIWIVTPACGMSL